MAGYSDEQREIIVRAICENVIENKLSFTQAVNVSPISYVSFFNWISESDKLKELYNYAREIRSDILFEEIIDIADTTEIGETIKDTPVGITTETGDMLGHRKLKIDARKWVIAKMQPKKYGDKLDLTTDGEKLQSSAPTIVFVDKFDDADSNP